MVIVLPIDTIITDPTVRGGRPVIAGTRIRVQDVAAARVFHGQTPEEIAVDYALNIAQVYAALAYYYEHKADFDAQFSRDEETAERLREELSAQGKLLP